MLKKILTALVCLTVLTGCFGSATPQSGTDTAAIANQENLFTGTVKPLGANVYHVGTHRLESGGKLVGLLESNDSDINLDDYLDKEVEITGEKTKAEGSEIDLIAVDEIKLVTPVATTAPTAEQTYADTQFGFSVKYPGTLISRETRMGVEFLDGPMKIVEISAIDNRLKTGLLTFLTGTYGYTTNQLNKVAVGKLGGYAFKNSTGEVVYFARDAYVYALAWFDVDTEKRADYKRAYLTIIQSFSLADVGVSATGEKKVAGLGEFCGGIAGIECARGLACQLDGANPDAGGTCMVATNEKSADGSTQLRAASVPDAANLALISDAEKSRGWYYGDKTTKKPGTPATWILVDSGTRFAMWRRPDDEPATAPTLAEPTVAADALATDKKAVLTYLKDWLNTLAPEAPQSGSWNLLQIAFANPAYVYALYGNNGEVRRALFVYTVVDGQVALQLKAYFRPGSDRDWLLAEGTDVAAGKELTVVDAGGKIESTVLAGFKEYVHKSGFRLQYPSSWYWKNTTQTKAEFSETSGGGVSITVEIVSGVDFLFGDIKTEGNLETVYLRLNDKQSVKISGSKSYDTAINTMVQTFKK